MSSWIFHEMIIKFKTTGNEAYYTNSSILLVKNMLRSKRHCQKGLNLIPFPDKIAAGHQSSSAGLAAEAPPPWRQPRGEY